MKSKSQRVSIWCVPLSHLSPPWFSFSWSSSVHWSFSFGCSPTLPAMLFVIARECWGCSDVFLRACQVRPTNAQLGTNLDCTVASRVVQCCFFARKSWQTLATWGRALSCWKVIWWCCTNGTATGRRISSLHLTAVRFPGTTINGDFTPCEIPPHTITDPPPYLSLSKTQASAHRSPRRHRAA